MLVLVLKLVLVLALNTNTYSWAALASSLLENSGDAKSLPRILLLPAHRICFEHYTLYHCTLRCTAQCKPEMITTYQTVTVLHCTSIPFAVDFVHF